MDEPHPLIVIISILLLCIGLGVTCSKLQEPNEITKNITIVETSVDKQLKVVSSEPKIYSFVFAKDFFKVQKGKTYKVYVIHANITEPDIYDVGPEVTEGTK